jgi:hypothetical protein
VKVSICVSFLLAVKNIVYLEFFSEINSSYDLFIFKIMFNVNFSFGSLCEPSAFWVMYLSSRMKLGMWIVD